MPRLGQWVNSFSDILATGYIAKETVNCSPCPDGVEIAGKGFSRVSSCLFIVLYGNKAFEDFDGDVKTDKFKEDKSMFESYLCCINLLAQHT